jgi:excisionase family DNA binding protein
VTLAELLTTVERQAAEAEHMQAHAPVAAVLNSVLEELRAIEGSSASTAEAVAQTTDRLLTVQEAAELLSVTPRWLYRRANTLPFIRRLSRRALRISKAGLERWIERRH